jgi:hypothetical protein
VIKGMFLGKGVETPHRTAELDPTVRPPAADKTMRVLLSVFRRAVTGSTGGRTASSSSSSPSLASSPT